MQRSFAQTMMGLTALSALCGVVLHDTHLDKVTIHTLSHADGAHDVAISSHPHTHAERTQIKGSARAVRDPRDDKLKHFDALAALKVLTPEEDSHILQLPENV